MKNSTGLPPTKGHAKRFWCHEEFLGKSIVTSTLKKPWFHAKAEPSWKPGSIMNSKYRTGLPWWLSGKSQLSMQEAVSILVWENATCHGATEPKHHNYWACARPQKPQLLKPTCPTACAPQQKKLLQWKPVPHSQRAVPNLCNQRKAMETSTVKNKIKITK